MSSYEERKKLLEAGYQARQEGRRQAQERKAQVLDRQMELLEQEREDAGRDAYIRQQQQLTALPEQLSAYGINGGGAETSLLKINTEYNKAREQIRSAFAQSAGEVHQQRLDAESEYAAGLAADRADYYERLAQLAAEIAEAQAAERARQEEMKLAWAKLQKQSAASTKNPQVSEGSGDGGDDKDGKDDKDDKDEKNNQLLKLERVKVPHGNAVQQATQVGYELLVNPVKYDGSGSYYIEVDGERMTPEEFQRAKKTGMIYSSQGSMGSVLYHKTGSTRQTRLSLLKSLRG